MKEKNYAIIIKWQTYQEVKKCKSYQYRRSYYLINNECLSIGNIKLKLICQIILRKRRTELHTEWTRKKMGIQKWMKLMGVLPPRGAWRTGRKHQTKEKCRRKQWHAGEAVTRRTWNMRINVWEEEKMLLRMESSAKSKCA